MGKWTAADIADQHGRTIVVTGANSGIGLIAARELARAGARVVLACRDLTRGEQAAELIRERAAGADVEVAELDLADLSSVRRFAGAFADRHEGLDVLINNAGVMALPRRETADGFEMHIGTNHLGHFALTGLLLDRLLVRPSARVVTVSSSAHRMGKIDLDDLHGVKHYWRWSAYAQSKLANLLFAFELQRRVDAAGLKLRSVAAHPGYAATNLQSAGPRMEGSGLKERGWAIINRIVAQSDEMGGLPTLYAATVDDLEGGSYVGPDRFFEQRGHPTLVDSTGRSKDPEVARLLWELSEEVTGVRYPFPQAERSA